jgi:cytochrome o ubiquinol oxidase subunit 2
MHQERHALLGRGVVVCLLPFALGGCGGVLDPAGPVGAGEKIILLDSLAIMLVIVVPTILLTVAFAWWFRASNTKARYLPDWEYSGKLELLVWSIPALVVLFLGGIGWVSSHDLDPAKPLVSTTRPIEVQVISLDWKWLFLYPDQGIASVNRLVVPAGVPVHFRLTSATVWNSFFVPRLGSQIYTMAGMTTQLNLQADKPGSYPGISAQFSGDGFSDMRFTLDAVPQAQFAGWIERAKAAGPVLDTAGYAALAQHSKAVVPFTYRAAMPGLFDAVVKMQAPSAETPHAGRPNAAVSPRTEG